MKEREREKDAGERIDRMTRTMGRCFVSRQALTVRLFGRDKSTTVEAGSTANSAS